MPGKLRLSKESSNILKIVDFDVVSESVRLSIIVTMIRERWAVPR